MVTYNDITSNIKIYLNKNRMSVNQLSDKSGIPRRRCHDVVTGREEMTFDELYRIAEGLDVDLSDLTKERKNKNDEGNEEDKEELEPIIMDYITEAVNMVHKLNRFLSIQYPGIYEYMEEEKGDVASEV